ncbi:hypothetical protein SERLA73DRAFT_180029 [Serpula lacrymans var. lacrymans S7.3]|uniref:Uncharacterized protein n=2 Tax=Serpula lacrymans var. lacrymans TaxID=341189 RepID=F8PVJ5_SERL3|nr:uncharacterized protein SERLADRAFT_465447 [Serpula lacrymans var. lacrymans S7.9]EGN99812.1 hypothetical protein SERLA73DRAFT_180029 [Serpula lacrymans var. lacrymans S7.3]EGO25382.1 hypothetical protein SERLADRAFT_465447 [Serpula lacrymans var. lacrymans S7.9]
MASEEEVNLVAAHAPHEKAIEAFNHVLHTIKHDLIKTRHDWDKHDPRTFLRVKDLSDAQLTHFSVENDLIEIRTGAVSYGTIILGKIRIPAVNDAEGQGFVHVRIHDPPNRGEEDVTFHSLHIAEAGLDADGHPHIWKAIQRADDPLAFFNI